MFKLFRGYQPLPKQPLSPELKRCVEAGDPFQRLIIGKLLHPYIELLNYPEKLDGKQYSDMHRPLEKLEDPLVYTCIFFGNRPCFLAEALKRGANPNEPRKLRDEIVYPTTAIMNSARRFSVRMLLLYGGNFDLPSTVRVNNVLMRFSAKDMRDKVADYPHWWPQSFSHRLYGPIEHWPNALPSQQIAWITSNNSMTAYLAQVEQEVAQLRQLRQQADIKFSAEDYASAAQLYQEASAFTEQFAGDHEELALFYLDLALEPAMKALQCYEQTYTSSNFQPLAKDTLMAYLQQQVQRIRSTLTPNPAIQPCRYNEIYPNHPNELILTNPEEVKCLEGSAVRDSIVNYLQAFTGKLDYYASYSPPLHRSSGDGQSSSGLRHRIKAAGQ